MNLHSQSAHRKPLLRHTALAVLLCSFLAAASWVGAQSAGDPIAWIDGDGISIRGQMSLAAELGPSVIALSNGAEVTVRGGSARIAFPDGSEVGVCGPASFSVLQSGESRTLALNSGRLHLRLSGPGGVLVYTPLVSATPIALGPEGVREATIGVDAEGSFCAWSGSGAIRLEHQLTGQALVVPQTGEISLPGSQMDALLTTRGACGCDAMLARKPIPIPARRTELAAVPAAPTNPPAPGTSTSRPAPANSLAPAGTRTELSALATPRPLDPSNARAPEQKPPAVEHPKWLVLMPPLSFDPTKPPPPEPALESILLLREVRVSPTVVFTGRIAPPEPPPAPVQSAANTAPAIKPKRPGGLFNSLGSFFGRLFGRKAKAPCTGAGCP